MTRLIRTLLAVVFTAALALGAPRPFPQEKSDLKADASVRFGSLPNGLRYAVKANAEPRGRAALRLLIDTGSFMETESQLGLAHFLEHMSFNGSTHYAPGTLIEFFQRMGMNFGGDTNAYTSFDHTVYQIDLPDTKPETLAEGLRVFSDYASGLLLLENEIEKERGVILAEKRARDSVDYRILEAELAFAYPGTLIPTRLPIGTEAVISKAPRAEFLDYYNTWYRPGLMSVVVVGDFDAAEVEARIRDAFAGVADRAPERPAPVLGSVQAGAVVRAGHHHEAEAAATEFTLRRLSPHVARTKRAEEIVAELPLQLAVSMVNQRFSELAKLEGAPFSRASMHEGEVFAIMREASVSVVCKPHQWKKAVAVGEQELRRALQHGFRPAELRMAVANLRNALEQAVKTEPTRRSDEIADQLVGTLQDDQVYTSSADDLALIGPALSTITEQACAEALRKVWGADGRSLFLSGNYQNEGDVAAELRAAYFDSLEKPVDAPADKAELTWTYTDFGPAGELVSRVEVADLGITQLRFANGVRLNLKRTDFEVGQLAVRVRIGSGLLTEPREQPGLGSFAGNFFTLGGLGKLSSDDLRQVLAGRNVGVGFKVEEDTLIFAGKTTPDDAALQLQLMLAYIVDPGFRPETARQFEKMVEQYYNRVEHSVEGVLQMNLPQALAGGDSRFGLPSRGTMGARTLDEMRTWLTAQFADGPVELSIVGDFDPERLIPLVAATFGTLPKRSETQPDEALRRVEGPSSPVVKELFVDTKIDKALIALCWPTKTDTRDYRRVRRLGLLADVFSDRLRVKIREELGDSYSPDVGQDVSYGFRNHGFLEAYLHVDPVKAEKLALVVREISEQLRRDGVGEDELKRAKLPMLTGQRESLRKNGYWLNSVLDSSQADPWRLEASRNRLADTESVTAAELTQLAAEVLGSERAHSFILRPKSAGAPADASAP